MSASKHQRPEGLRKNRPSLRSGGRLTLSLFVIIAMAFVVAILGRGPVANAATPVCGTSTSNGQVCVEVSTTTTTVTVDAQAQFLTVPSVDSVLTEEPCKTTCSQTDSTTAERDSTYSTEFTFSPSSASGTGTVEIKNHDGSKSFDPPVTVNFSYTLQAGTTSSPTVSLSPLPSTTDSSTSSSPTDTTSASPTTSSASPTDTTSTTTPGSTCQPDATPTDASATYVSGTDPSNTANPDNVTVTVSLLNPACDGGVVVNVGAYLLPPGASGVWNAQASPQCALVSTFQTLTISADTKGNSITLPIPTDQQCVNGSLQDLPTLKCGTTNTTVVQVDASEQTLPQPTVTYPQGTPGYLGDSNTNFATFTETAPACVVTVTPVTPTATDATCTSPNSIVTVPTTAGVLYEVNGKDASGTTIALTPGQSVSIQPVAAKGYKLDKNYEPYVFSDKLDTSTCTTPPVDQTVTPVTPTATDATCTSPNSIVTVPTTAGVLYEVNGKDASGTTIALTPGQSVSIQPVAAKGYKLDKNYEPYVFSDKLNSATCTTTVTPVSPTVTSVATCANTDETVTPSTQQGVVWNHGVTTLKVGGTVTFVASPAKGFVFPAGATTSFTFVDGVTGTCTTNTPTTPGENPPGQVTTGSSSRPAINVRLLIEALLIGFGALGLWTVYSGASKRRRSNA